MTEFDIVSITGDFWIYVRTHTPATPWVIRFVDKSMPLGFNEVIAKSWKGMGLASSHEDAFIEAKLGKWSVKIEHAIMTYSYSDKVARFQGQGIEYP